MEQPPNRLWIIAILLGWVFDFLFWRRSAGINFAVWTGLILLGGFYLLISNGLKPAPMAIWLIALFVFFAVITFARREPLTLFLAYIFSLVAMGLLAVTYLGGRWTRYSLLDYFSKFLLLLGGIISLPASFFSQVIKTRRERGWTFTKWPLVPVLRGLLITIPVVAFFAILLASADLVFNQKIREFFGLFSFERINETILRLVIVLFWAYSLAGAFLHAASKSQDEKLLGEDKPVVKPFLGFIESATVLGSVSILFLLFVIVQFRYFFGGNENIGVEGYTYSQYARQGFNELLAVAFFSLLLTLGLTTVTRRENHRQRNIYSGLNIAIAALVMVMLTSAYQRLALATDWHGFSRLRLYPQIFMVWVGILFVAVVLLEVLHRERYFAFAAVLASIGFVVSLSLFNVDASIVRHNVQRAVQGKHFNVAHLASLSTDAVPALANEFMDASLPTSIHEGIGAALVCYVHSEAISVAPASDWRSFNLSQWNARKALVGVQAYLPGYRVNDKGRTIRVRTPGDVWYPCSDTERYGGIDQ